MLMDNIFSLSGKLFLINTLDYIVYSKTEKAINVLCHVLMSGRWELLKIKVGNILWC
jgi:hypothetical protein